MGCFFYGLGGNAVRFFLFVFFVSGSVSSVVFSVLLVLGSLFGKIFGSELLFLSVVVGLVFFDCVLPRLLFYYLVFRSRKCLGKILLMSGPLFGKIFESELLFLSVVVGLVFFDSVLPRFLFYYLVFRSRKCLGKILLMSGPLFGKIFGSELLFFGVGVGCVFFFVLFCLCFCSIIWFFQKKLPKMSRKNSLDVRSCVSGFFGLAVRSFSGRFSGPEMPHFCCPKTACEKLSLS